MTRSRTAHPFLRYQLPALLWALTIFVLSSIPAHSIPSFEILSQDKLLHLLVYFILTGLLYVAILHQTRFPSLARRPELWAALIAIIYGATDEVHQSFTGRSADVLDWVADLAGALLLLAIVSLVRAIRRTLAR